MRLKNSLGLNRSKIMLTLAVVLVASSGLYWWPIRHYAASKSCHNIALENSGYSKDNSDLWLHNNNSQRSYMFIYDVCMHKEGINP
jgi:hypothetical protein